MFRAFLCEPSSHPNWRCLFGVLFCDTVTSLFLCLCVIFGGLLVYLLSIYCVAICHQKIGVLVDTELACNYLLIETSWVSLLI